MVRCTSINGSNKKHGFTRKRNTDAFNANKYQNGQIAICSEQTQKVGCSKMEHAVVLSLFTRNFFGSFFQRDGIQLIRAPQHLCIRLSAYKPIIHLTLWHTERL